MVMPTVNKKLQALTLSQVNDISLEYLKGWRVLESKYGFRLRGLNAKRKQFGLKPLSDEMSFDYKLNYVKANYSKDEICKIISDYMNCHDMTTSRWTGIELFDCCFGREWAKFMTSLIGDKYVQLSEKARVHKLTLTQLDLYGGVGLGGKAAKEKAIQTNLLKWGCDNPMKNESVQKTLGETNLKKYGSISPFGSQDIQQKSMVAKVKNQRKDFIEAYVGKKNIRSESKYEFIIFKRLTDRFGVDDVYYHYGIHPSDKRYPYSCDFYIKSLDLFIEYNGHYSHGPHWFDVNSHDDQLRVKHLLDSGKLQNKKAVKIWCEFDVNKRNKAKAEKLKYLVFWDSSVRHVNKKQIPVLSDFYLWFNDYDCNYDSFVKDHPENTY